MEKGRLELWKDGRLGRIVQWNDGIVPALRNATPAEPAP